MDNLLRKIESDEVVVYTDQVYSIDVLNKCREIHKKLVDEGKIEGDFDSDKWMGYSGVKKFGMDFSMDIIVYNKHIGKEFGITADTMKNMLRCYAIYCNGVYVYQTIAREKIGTVKDFLLKYKDKDFKLTTTGITTVEDFLGFIGTPDKQIEQIVSNIRLIKNDEKAQRELSPIINYLVIENEINHIYREGCDDETFKKWFPIYFWVNITFILPLRATEMLLTPKKCIYRENDKTFLRIRRTRLKKGTRTVYYDVNKDYKEFTYEIPDTDVIRNIEKYMEMTDSQDRRFLFEYNELMINDMLSLQAFNHLVAAFVEEHIIGNNRYDFAKYATGITEFEPVTAGDSRPIAMANLYFQKSGEDICRQLADHININTSSGYYTNISETIWASSVVQLMAKTQKYSEDQLLEAVIKFSEVEKKKIKATELADWCRRNIEGLEEVRDYHFTRSVKEKDEKTGKMVERPKLCTLKIEEINKSRSLTVSINTNLLLRASNIDTFMEQPDATKRKMIVETRETVDKLLTRNGNITRENEALRAENKSMKSNILIMTDKIDALQKAQDKLIKQVSYLMKATDEAARKEMLSQMGIEDESVDLNTYSESLQQELSEVMDINKSLRLYLSETDDILDTKEKQTNITGDIMSGLDF